MSATNSGLSLVVPSVMSSFTGTVTGFAVGWTRRLKWPLLSSAILLLVGTICLCLLTRGLPPLLYFIVLLPMAVGQGLGFPGTFLAILSTSPQSEQAVVTSTLILWRSVGSVLGIATSSLVLQNALLSYLQDLVAGDLKDEVISRVRRSVEAVADLEPPYQQQVIASYEAALRLTFIVCTGFALVSIVLVAPIKLPRLGVRK
jgi:MFS family permease